MGSNPTPDIFFFSQCAHYLMLPFYFLDHSEINELYKQRKELRETFAQEQEVYSEAVRKSKQALYRQEREDAQRREEERKTAREARKKQK